MTLAAPGSLESLTERIGALVPARDHAPIALLVVREPGEGRLTPARVILDPEHGVVGDRWARGKRDRECQVTLMRWDVAALVGASPALLGDNLFATLDTSADNLPAGAIVRVGGATCRVTAKPHTGCRKFRARTVEHALAVTKAHPDLRLRGVHFEVLEGGEVSLGDAITVVSR